MEMQTLKKIKELTATVMVTALLLIFMFSSSIVDGRQIKSTTEGCCRPDVLIIDSAKIFGDLERQPVLFFHDKHTDALEKKDKDCRTCHLSEKDRLSPKFKRFNDAGRQEVMDIYHSGCMGCHTEMYAEKDKTGPVEICGECHRDKVKVQSSRQPMGFDQSLHFRHLKATGDKCERCHHEYDEKTKKLFYAEGKEGTCRYCHMAEAEKNRIPMRVASHLFCIDCHRKTRASGKAKNKIAGPVKCAGCHDFDKQQLIKKVKDVPRIKRKQPDVVLIRAAGKGTSGKTSGGQMNPVPMDHKAHEKYNDTCRACHHESLDSCSECHTLAGTKEGKDVKLERAMHQIGTTKSCIGCHELRYGDKKCAGCHAFIQNGQKQSKLSCFRCHMESLQPDTEAVQQPEAVASGLLGSRKALAGTYADEDIPEKIIIGELIYEYEPVGFPHKKIIDSLLQNIKDSQLTNYFHSEKGVICQACHHNSPISKKPPRCVSCHGKTFDEANLLRPGLQAAYHRQCMGCHKEMSIEKPKSTECNDCHKATGKSRLYD